MPPCVIFIHFDHTITVWSCFSVPATQEDITGALTCPSRDAFDESRKHLNNKVGLVTLLASYMQQLAYSSTCRSRQNVIRGCSSVAWLMLGASAKCQHHCVDALHLVICISKKGLAYFCTCRYCHGCKHCHHCKRIQAPCCGDWFFMSLVNVNTTHMFHG